MDNAYTYFTVRKTKNGYLLDVEDGESFGQYCFIKTPPLIKAIKLLIDGQEESKPQQMEVPF